MTIRASRDQVIELIVGKDGVAQVHSGNNFWMKTIKRMTSDGIVDVSYLPDGMCDVRIIKKSEFKPLFSEEASW